MPIKPGSNLTVLEDNVLNGLSTDEGCRAFLWAAQKKDASRHLYKEEAFAHEVEALFPIIEVMVAKGQTVFNKQSPNGLIMTSDQADDLRDFILKRHCFYRFPGEKVSWLE